MKPFAASSFVSPFFCAAACCLLAAGCRPANQSALTETVTLPAARRGFKTALVPPAQEAKDPVETAPAKVFRTVTYPAQSGNLAAYLSPDPGDGKKHAAIIWITGGDCNSIGDVWTAAPHDNDQTAAAYRKAGMIMLFPSLRGGNTNPGTKEGFLGEVDDVLAAEKFLEKQPYVDAKRIYLGGHSTGGTLALLVSECSPKFRAAFAFGPVAFAQSYGDDSGFLPYNTSDKQENKLRSPAYWLGGIKSPIWVFEGSEQDSNVDSLRAMRKISDNPNVHFVEISGATHFDGLAPTNEIIADKIRRDTGPKTNLTFDENEVSKSANQ